MLKLIKGLEGVIALESSVASVDGKKGILKYRGYNIKDLAKHSSFEEVMYLLWFKKLPTKRELTNFKKKLRAERSLEKGYTHTMQPCTRHMTGMDALRTVISHLAHCDPDLNKNTTEANIRKAIRLAPKFPTIVATFWRIREGKKIIAPRKDFGSGANFLYMLTGKVPDKLQAKAMELDFLLTAEHTLNASTFTGRIVCSTLSDMHSAIVAAISSLKGPLHGGARSAVYQMLDEVKSPKNAEQYIMGKIKRKEKIMGFGHRVYKVMDPRAKIFKQMAKELAKTTGNTKWYDMATEIERVVLRELVEKRGKPIHPNVDFYAAVIYKYVGIPKELSTSIFALGRIAGWVAHFLEQYEDNRLIRPLISYVGPKTNKYIPLEKR